MVWLGLKENHSPEYTLAQLSRMTMHLLLETPHCPGLC